MLSGNDLPTRRQSIKKLERSTLSSVGLNHSELQVMKSFVSITRPNLSHLVQQSTSGRTEFACIGRWIQIPKMDSQDHSPAPSLVGSSVVWEDSNSHRKGKYSTLEEADNDVLDGMRSHFASHPSFISRPSHSTSQSVFGIKHWSGPVSYDASGIIQADLGLVDVEFVTLLRNSSDSFVSRLLSGPSLALDRHPLDPSVLVAAQVSSSPLRRPSPILPTHPHISLEPGSPRGAPLDSTVALIDTSVVQPTLSQLNATLSQFISHFSQCQVWNVLNIKPNEELYANDWDPVRVRHQLNALRVPELIVRKKVDYPFDFDLTMFSMRFRLEGTEANDLRRQLSTGLMLEENQDFAIGRSRVWLTFRAFQSLEERLSAEQPAGSQQRPIAGHLAGFDIPGGSPRELDSWGDLGGGGSGSYQHLIPSGSGNGDDRPNSGYEAERNIPQSPGFGGEGQLHDAPHGGPMGYHDGPAQSRVWGSEWESKQPMEEQDMLSKEERYMDVGMIKHNQVGGQIEGNTNRDGATDAVLLKTDQNQTLEEVESRVRGQVFDLAKFWRGQHSDITGQPVTNSDMLSLAGQDLTNYFPVPLKLACPNVLVDTVNLQFENWTATVPNAVHVSGSGQVVKASALGNEKWYTEKFLPFMTNFYKGPIVYTRKLIADIDFRELPSCTVSNYILLAFTILIAAAVVAKFIAALQLEGSKQLNYGKVYSGLYEVDGHVVPYVVVAKVGKPSERSKPGNRGKRDSQILLMKFLNRVHFDAPMCPLELEICHQIKNVIGVDPQLYEFVLFTIDADTEVYPDALNRLVSALMMVELSEFAVKLNYLMRKFLGGR
ncbi:hypothetical protein KEM48_013614 [Puccinia striiformis f. sp. tritici PST-130]|nr:hypothetical protein KEM48_013614 [Puccinia striiformis f. sp. tritici PST-130]